MSIRPTRPAISRLVSLAAAAIALAACGAPAENTPTRTSDVAGGDPGKPQPIKPIMRGDLDSATVYDAAGAPRACGPAESTCPPVAPNLQFQDQCRLAGFQVRQCGCEVVCSGNIAKKPKQYYDASGNPSPCDEPDAACTPPPAKAAFQDACIEKGHHLKTCGCSWLCSGNPVKTSP